MHDQSVTEAAPIYKRSGVAKGVYRASVHGISGVSNIVASMVESGKWDEFRKGWPVLVPSVLGVMVSVSVAPIYAIGAFVKPLQSEFHWSRGSIQYALTSYFVGAIFGAALCGWLLRTFKLRAVAIASLLGNALGFMLMSQLNSSIGSLYLGLFALIILGAGTMSATWTLATSRQFERNRGLALAIILSGSGLASALAPSYVTALSQAYGWRIAFIGLGLPSLILALPAVMVFMPSPVSASRTGAPPDRTALVSSCSIPGVSLRDALRSRRLWILGIGLMLIVMGILGVIPNLIPLLTDAGLTGKQAASLVGLIGVSLTVSRVGSGYLIDRLWAPGVAAALFSAPALSCALLLCGAHSTAMLAMVVILIGIGTGAENDIAAYLTARYFGLREYGSVFSAVTVIISAGNVISPLIFGFLYDATGTYMGMLWTSAGFFVTGSALVLTMGRYPSFSETNALKDLSHRNNGSRAFPA